MTLYELTNSMDKVMRFSHTYNIKAQPLSSHTLRVMALSYELSKGKYDIDYERLFMTAMLHDAEEVFCGDIVSPVKKYFTNYDEITAKVIENNLDKSLLPYYTSKGSKEYIIVKLADLVDTPLQALEELNRGNQEHIKYLDKFIRFMEDPDGRITLSYYLNPKGSELFEETYEKCKHFKQQAIELNRV